MNYIVEKTREFMEMNMPNDYEKLKTIENRGLKLNNWQIIELFKVRGMGRTYLEFVKICEECLTKKGKIIISQTKDVSGYGPIINLIRPQEVIYDKKCFYSDLLGFINHHYPEIVIVEYSVIQGYMVVRIKE